MNRAELLDFHTQMTQRCHALLARKNSDYATERDQFANLEMCERMGLCSTEHGILIRITDKLTRIGNLLSKGGDPAVLNESLQDTCDDVVNYMVLLAAKMLDRQNDRRGKTNGIPSNPQTDIGRGLSEFVPGGPTGPNGTGPLSRCPVQG